MLGPDNARLPGAVVTLTRRRGGRSRVAAGGRFDVGWSTADEQKARTDLAFAYLGTCRF